MKYIRTFESFREEDFELMNEEINLKKWLMGLALTAKLLMPGSASAKQVETEFMTQKPQVVQTINSQSDWDKLCLSLHLLNGTVNIKSSDVDFRLYQESAKEYLVMVYNEVDQSKIEEVLGDKYENSKRLASNMNLLAEKLIKERGRESVKEHINAGSKILNKLEGTINWDDIHGK
jgi:hypothetical protein